MVLHSSMISQRIPTAFVKSSSMSPSLPLLCRFDAAASGLIGITPHVFTFLPPISAAIVFC